MKLWWQVAFDKTGAILSVEEREAEEKSGRLVCYVQAYTKAEACTAAQGWYASYIAKRRAAQKKRRDSLKAAGLCTICRAPVCAESTICCQRHLDFHRERHAAWARGEAAPRSIATPEELKARIDAMNRKHNPRFVKLRVQLTHVLETFDELGPERFREWVVDEIRRRWGDGPLPRRRSAPRPEQRRAPLAEAAE